MSGEDEVIDGEPVLEEQPARIVSHAAQDTQTPVLRRASSSAAVQAAAAAAGGFVAGAAVLGLVQHRQRRASALTRPQRSARLLGRRRSAQASSNGAGDAVQIIATRSLLVDVHLLGGPTPPGES